MLLPFSYLQRILHLNNACRNRRYGHTLLSTASLSDPKTSLSSLFLVVSWHIRLMFFRDRCFRISLGITFVPLDFGSLSREKERKGQTIFSLKYVNRS